MLSRQFKYNFNFSLTNLNCVWKTKIIVKLKEIYLKDKKDNQLIRNKVCKVTTLATF